MNDYYNDKSSSTDRCLNYWHHIDNLIFCGLTEKFHQSFSESYWLFGGDYVYDHKFYREGDINLLVIIFKGLVICETESLKRANSVSPVNFINKILIQRLSASLYNEIAEWALQRYQASPVNPYYRPKFQRIVKTRGYNCSSCTTHSFIPIDERHLTQLEYITLLEAREKQRHFEKNKCPKCKKYELKRNQTRWGNIRICSNYPQCNYVEN